MGGEEKSRRIRQGTGAAFLPTYRPAYDASLQPLNGLSRDMPVVKRDLRANFASQDSGGGGSDVREAHWSLDREATLPALQIPRLCPLIP